jgi:hypothetical protein
MIFSSYEPAGLTRDFIFILIKIRILVVVSLKEKKN